MPRRWTNARERSGAGGVHTRGVQGAPPFYEYIIEVVLRGIDSIETVVEELHVFLLRHNENIERPRVQEGDNLSVSLPKALAEKVRETFGHQILPRKTHEMFR